MFLFAFQDTEKSALGCHQDWYKHQGFLPLSSMSLRKQRTVKSLCLRMILSSVR